MPTAAIQAEIATNIELFRFNSFGLTELLQGPVVADLVRRAIRVESQAKRNATQRPGPRVRTGRLRGSITWRVGRDIANPYVDVGTAVFYAPFVELGTRYARPYPFLRPALEAARTP